MADVIDSVLNYNVAGAAKDFLGQAVWYLLYGGIAIAIIYLVYSKIQFKRTFKFIVTAKRRRGLTFERKDYPAAYITDRDGMIKFVIRLGRFPWNDKKMDILPDTNYMDGNRFYYQINDPETWVQTKMIEVKRPIVTRRIRFLADYNNIKAGTEGENTEDITDTLVADGIAEYIDDGNRKEIELSDELFEPIPSDRKQITIMKLQAARSALGIEGTKQVAIFTIGIIVLAVIFIVGYYFMTNPGG